MIFVLDTTTSSPATSRSTVQYMGELGADMVVWSNDELGHGRQSVAENEFAECGNKARAVVRAIERARQG